MKLKTILLRILGVIAGLVVVGYAAFQWSPWPSVLMIRYAFGKGSDAASQSLQKHVPTGISAVLDQHYDEADPDAYLDVFRPASAGAQPLPTIVWVHGGAWVSGHRRDVANYARVLAGQGFTVVAVGYSIAPGQGYPVPVRQVNTALGYLVREAARLGVDPARLVLAGDSAGAHIVAQVANAVAVPSYAKAVGLTPVIAREQLRGMLLHCGAYDAAQARLDGAFGGFLRTVFWSYSGSKDFQNAPAFETASVRRYVTGAFPPSFITAGNGDPLEGQSRSMAETLAAKGVQVDSLFFPADQSPALPHEYQFNLDDAPGRLALERSLQFLRRVMAP